ncbi:hypothetical protein BGZ68_009272 [Mortierella alpina]|nr:hypothetical protein BGZ68_009272 [Mortierella alpina]
MNIDLDALFDQRLVVDLSLAGVVKWKCLYFPTPSYAPITMRWLSATEGKDIKTYVVLAKKNANDSVITKDQALSLLDQCVDGLFQKDQVTTGYAVAVDKDVVLALHIDILL